ncbi:MAG TPA: hypothetical protein DHM37_09895 [Candidatus Cloacimonas sp.]|jgi:F420-0:gamma-glutamyl ligase-like protein|nr:hypothetical protein [Candidatus Cloacimonadota bacterium]HCX74017.1 hypothetical protein [Candidatus Cloacimonas sp.]
MNTSSQINVAGKTFQRILVKTKILNEKDDILDVIEHYAVPILQTGDIITISESPLAITQGRAIPVSQIKVGFLAKILWPFVANVEYGIGLRAPTSMQCAIDEVGSFRILLAAAGGALGKLIGRKGDFYRIAGKQAALIDAATTSPVPPYENCVIKGPAQPDKVARKICDKFGFETAIMDINDIGGSWVIGKSSGINSLLLETIMKDNPQGQAAELTPICIIREIK